MRGQARCPGLLSGLVMLDGTEHGLGGQVGKRAFGMATPSDAMLRVVVPRRQLLVGKPGEHDGSAVLLHRRGEALAWPARSAALPGLPACPLRCSLASPLARRGAPWPPCLPAAAHAKLDDETFLRRGSPPVPTLTCGMRFW